jgi:hypothetical protein
MIKSNIRSLAFGLVLICLVISVFIINQSFRSFARTFEAGSPGDSAFFNKPYKLPENVSFAGEKMPLSNFDT